jgi:hypothetical protein
LGEAVSVGVPEIVGATVILVVAAVVVGLIIRIMRGPRDKW